MALFTINISGQLNLLQLNEINSSNNVIKFFNISEETAPNNIRIEFELITPPTTATVPFITIGGVPTTDNFGNPAQLNNINDVLQYDINNVTSLDSWNILFGTGTVFGDEGTVRCRLISASVDSVPSPNFIDIDAVNYDDFGVLEVDDCNDNSGFNTLVFGTGFTPGTQIFKQSDGLPFNGGNNNYFITQGGLEQFYSDSTPLSLSGFTVQIDNTGTIVSQTLCNL